MAGGPDEERGDDALRERLETLSRSLDAGKASAERAEIAPAAEDKTMASAIGLGFRVMTEFVAATAVGALIGWALDRWLHTSPAMLIVFLALGTAAGFWNVYKIAARPTGGPSY